MSEGLRDPACPLLPYKGPSKRLSNFTFPNWQTKFSIPTKLLEKIKSTWSRNLSHTFNSFANWPAQNVRIVYTTSTQAVATTKQIWHQHLRYLLGTWQPFECVCACIYVCGCHHGIAGHWQCKHKFSCWQHTLMSPVTRVTFVWFLDNNRAGVRPKAHYK